MLRGVFLPSVAAILGCTLTGIGCNAILGNDEAALDEDGSIIGATADGSVDATLPVTEAGAPGPSLNDAGTDAPAVTVDGGPGATSPDCDPGEKLCFGTCVSVSDPRYGCAGAACNPCALPRAAATCAGGACAIGSCNAGYADCNQKPGDGCETDLSKPAHCGTCNATCPASAPICASAGAQFACTNGCSPPAPTRCGSQCIDLSSSVTNCGQCGIVCNAVPNGQVACQGGTCRFTCDPGFHVCGGGCASNSDVATCGNRCSPCNPPDNATPTCTNGACDFACVPGFHRCGNKCERDDSVKACGLGCVECPKKADHGNFACIGGACVVLCDKDRGDCDGFPGNGCEVSFQSDRNNCGRCRNGCSVSCILGACVPF